MTADTPDTHLQARIDAATAMRRLGNAMLAHQTDTDLLRRIASAAHTVADDVEVGPVRDRPIAIMKKTMWGNPPPDGAPMTHFDDCVVSGTTNPMGIGMRPRRVGDTVVADFSFAPAFEGAPGRAHGGAVAAVFDDLMGYVLMILATPAYTGELSVRYAAPTPIATPVHAEASLVERTGRKLTITASLSHVSGEPIATASGLFIAIPPERISGD